MNVLFTASGTGGHVVPAIRLARGVQKESDNCRVLFVGGKRGLEKEMITAAGYELVQIPARGFIRRQPWKNIPVLWALSRSMLACRRIVRHFKPDVAVGTGGYVTGPVIRAAHRVGVPTLIHEQNRRPGLTTRWLSRIADVVCVAFAETTSLLAHPERTKVTGNPIDADAISCDRISAATELGVAADRPTILITGGSQGAQSINNNIASGLEKGNLSADWQVVWQTGERDFHRYEALASAERGVVVQPFIADLAMAMAAADLVIGRAGALTIAEVTARGLPAILVPYPLAAADHQTQNAQALVEAGAGILVRDMELSTVDLLELAESLLADSAKLAGMRKNSRKLGQPEATDSIVTEILQLAEGQQRG